MVSRPRQSNSSERSDETTLPPLELFAWPTRSNPLETSKKPWHSSEAPSELCDIPQDENLPDILVNIINWSLIRSLPKTYTPNATEFLREDFWYLASIINAVDGTSQDTLWPIYKDPAAEIFGSLIPALSTSTTIPLDSDVQVSITKPTTDVKEEYASDTVRDGTKNGNLGKLRNLPFNLKGSIADLSSEIKLAREKVRIAKSTREARQRETHRSVECTGCFDDILAKSSISLSCSHAYCKTCFMTLIKTAMQNEQSWPAKCCLTEIPIRSVLLALNSKQRNEHKDKAAEYAIPPGERLYCPGSNCHKFIPPPKTDRRSSGQKCPHCFTRICRMCRGEAHAENEDCPEDYGLNAALESAHDEGWQRCYQCRTMVELTTGCRHITCKCGGQFCYVCGLRWRTCACTEANLVNRRAEVTRRRTERVQREAVRDAAAVREEQEIARAIAEVEAFERSQIAVREAERRRQEQEQREEAELLAQLEAISLAEEIERQEAEAFAEQQSRETLRVSVIEHIQFLHWQLQALTTVQQQTLHSRHEGEEATLKQQLDDNIRERSLEVQTMLAFLTINADKRRVAMSKKHVMETDALQADQESRADAVFAQMQTSLHNQPTREERQQRMERDFLRQFDEEQEHQQMRLSAERKSFDALLRQEKIGLQRSHKHKVEMIKAKHEQDLRRLSGKIDNEQEYFKFITERRTQLMMLHSKCLIADLDHSRESEGLTQEMAAANMTPFPTSTTAEPAALALPSKGIPSVLLTKTASKSPGIDRQRFDPGITSSKLVVPSTSSLALGLPTEQNEVQGDRKAFSIASTSTLGLKNSGGRRTKWMSKIFEKSKSTSLQKYSDHQIKEMLSATVGDAS